MYNGRGTRACLVVKVATGTCRAHSKHNGPYLIYRTAGDARRGYLLEGSRGMEAEMLLLLLVFLAFTMAESSLFACNVCYIFCGGCASASRVSFVVSF